MHFRSSLPARSLRGNMLVLGMLLVTLLAGLSTAFLFTTQKNSRQSHYLNNLNELRHLAESAVNQSVHELGYHGGGGDGKIGTELWLPANDLGRDGRSGTGDEGEGDGIPTPGEPSVSPVPVGPSSRGIRVVTHVADSQWSKVKRVVATAFNSEALATREAYVRVEPVKFTAPSAVYVEPGLALDLNSNAFKISGIDTNPDGTRGAGPDVYGISTATGTPAGSNATDLVNQIPSQLYDQIAGTGTTPSVSETGAVDLDLLVAAIKASPRTTVTTGVYSNVAWGNYQTNKPQITYCNGDLKLTGSGVGAGVLLVEGSLTITGNLQFAGLVIVLGDLRLSGGGTGVHIYGSAMIGDTLTAVDPNADLTFRGTADVIYSSAALAMVSNLWAVQTTVLYWNDLK